MHASFPFRSRLARHLNTLRNKRKGVNGVYKNVILLPPHDHPYQMAYVKRSDGGDRWQIEIA